jgi:hypothetical protein
LWSWGTPYHLYIPPKSPFEKGGLGQRAGLFDNNCGPLFLDWGILTTFILRIVENEGVLVWLFRGERMWRLFARRA